MRGQQSIIKKTANKVPCNIDFLNCITVDSFGKQLVPFLADPLSFLLLYMGLVGDAFFMARMSP